MSLWIDYKLGEVDWLGDLSGFIKKNKSGEFYCSCCENPKIYKTKREALINENFNDLIRWANENIRPELKCYYFGDTEKASVFLRSGHIWSEEQFEKCKFKHNLIEVRGLFR